MNGRERLDWVDAGRGVAIILVALVHATLWLRGGGFDTGGWGVVNDAVSTLRMPLFFALAGLFSARWIAAPWSELWRGKLRLFAWVLLLWTVIGAVFLQLGLILRDQCCSASGLLLPILLGAVRPQFELWFIWALALFFVVAKLLRRLPAPAQLGLAGVLTVAAFAGLEPDNVGWAGALRYLVFFLIGVHGRAPIIRFARVRTSIAVAVSATWAVVTVAALALDLRGVPGVYPVNCVLGLLAGVSISRALARVSWLRALGSRTLPVYLAHTPLIITTVFLLAPLAASASGGVLGTLLPPVVAAVGVVGAVLIARLEQRFPAVGVLYRPPRSSRRARDAAAAR